MPVVLLIIACLVAFVFILFVLLGIKSRTGEAPGMIEGRLRQCPKSPNCVCSEYPNDSVHYVQPLIIPEEFKEDPLEIIKAAVEQTGGNVAAATATYIAAEYTSAVFGFRDDFEFRVDSERKKIHIRSASRVGHSDMGVNRKRAEQLRNLIFQVFHMDGSK